jgi:hypothetical protein
MGETRVDLLHLLEDLRDAYPGSLEETIVSEIVANSLDSRAATVVFTADPAGRTLCVVDDGSGMTRSELRRYHDLAHPAFRRAAALHSEDYHVAITVALTLAPLTVEPGAERRFVTAFLTRWGDAAERRRARSRRAR